MPDARKAILTGTVEAARTHDLLRSPDRWEHEHGRIDVFGAIDHFGLPLMFQPMDGLLGAYLVQPSPGVLINTQRPLSVRRYTAAHELGHFRLKHQPSLDGEDMITRTPFADRLGYDPKEAEADAFAIAFLLPIWFVRGQMRRHGWAPADMKEPTNVYQLALRAGTSYEATCYALMYWFNLNWRPSTRALRTPGPDALRFKKAWRMLKVIVGRGWGRKRSPAADDHSSHTRPVIPGELDASRSRVCFTG